MKKTTEEELNRWRYQFPSSFISWRIEGDEIYAQNFIGEGQLLLWQVKNAMKFNKLDQHSITRPFTDGTVIEAKSVFGQDQIRIVTPPLLGVEVEAIEQLYSVMATWIRSEKRIYFDGGTPDTRYLIDITDATSDLEEAYLFKVIEHNPFIGALIYYSGDSCIVLKFECNQTMGTPKITWESNDYYKSSFAYVKDTFPAKLPSGSFGIPTPPTYDWGGVGFSFSLVEEDIYIVPKCLSLWIEGTELLKNLKYEIAGFFIPKYKDVVYSLIIGIEHLVYYRNNQWNYEGMVWESGGVILPVFHPYAAFLTNLDRFQFRHQGGYTSVTSSADVNYVASKVWPVMNLNGKGIAGYLVQYETRWGYDCFFFEDEWLYFDQWLWRERHKKLWWTPTNERIEIELDTNFGHVWLPAGYDNPSMDGNGYLDRATGVMTDWGSAWHPIEHIYRINNVYYNQSTTIPDSIFNPKLYPFGRQAIELRDAKDFFKLNYVPTINITCNDLGRSLVYDHHEWIPLSYPPWGYWREYFNYIENSQFTMIGKMKGLPNKAGFSSYGGNPSTKIAKWYSYPGTNYILMDMATIQTDLVWAYPTPTAQGAPYADRLCWFGLNKVIK